MILKQIKNIKDIKKVLCNPEIYDCISSDSSPSIEDFEPPIDNKYKYIGGFVNGEIIGLMVYHTYKDGNECHVQVLPEYRGKYAKEFGEQVLKLKGDLPLYAEIPDKYRNVLSFALLNGFEIIKKVSKGYIKNGVEYPVNELIYRG